MDIINFSQNNKTITTAGLTTVTMNITANLNGYITAFQLGSSDSSSQDGTLEIIQDGVTLVTKTALAWKFDNAPLIMIQAQEYTTNIKKGAFQIVYTRTADTGTTGTASYTGESLESFSYDTQEMMGRHSGQTAVALFAFTNIERATHNEKEVKTNYPVVEGTTFGTTKTHEKIISLQAENSIIPDRKMVGVR